jgi:hypothetical protein
MYIYVLGCHNFHKPNMSSARPEYMVVAPVATALWVRGRCEFLVEALVDADGSAGVHTKYLLLRLIRPRYPDQKYPDLTEISLRF